MAASPLFDDLRQRLDHRFREASGAAFTQAETAVVASGIPELDRALHGGFTRGTIATLEGAPSSGRTALAARVLAVATAGGLAAVVGEGLFPPSLAAAGVRLDRLVLVPVREPVAAARAADILLRSGVFGVVVMPALAIYFLYQPILEIAMRCRTPGKRMAGVRLISRSGGAPSTGALLMRNVFRLIDCMPVFYVVGLVATLISSQHLRIGDLAAGTLLVFDQDRNVRSLTQLGDFAAHTRLDAGTLDLVNDLLARWSELDAPSRRTLATTLLLRLDEQAKELPVAMLTEETVKSRLLALLKSGSARP